MTIEDVIEKYSDCGCTSPDDKNRIRKNYRRHLIAAGMDEDKADEEVERWGELTWSQDEWKDYYGLDSDDEF